MAASQVATPEVVAPSGAVDGQSDTDDGRKSLPAVFISIYGALNCLYIFLVGLQLLGEAFKCLGGRGAGRMFGAVSNPMAGLMVGILATVLVQSSSTSTSIVVGLVGAEQMTVKMAIPIIMGANIGTSVTNTLVSMGQVDDRIMLQRAFAGATVHDMFNMLTVLALLPLELIIDAAKGDGGPLFRITQAFADMAMDSGDGNIDDPLKDKSPVKIITSPMVKVVISNNKYIINALSLGAPAAIATSAVNTSAGCVALPRRLLWESSMQEEDDVNSSRVLLSRRLASDGLLSCSKFYCVGKDLDSNLKKISPTDYKEKLTECKGYISSADIERCGEDKCYLDAGKYYTKFVEEGEVIERGFVASGGDVGGGIIALIFALAILGCSFFGLCRILKFLVIASAKKYIIKVTGMNDYVAMFIGVVLTVVVQSSSITTSSLTPLCGVGAIPLNKMFPLTLGANIGTTATALIAALSNFTHDAIHIALCHLFFNLFGVLIWFPVPIMRRVPLGAARLLGLYASFFRVVPALYILLVFVIVPAIFLGISAAFDASITAGVVAVANIVALFSLFEFWWICRGGCYRVLSEAAREEGKNALEQADRELRGQQEEEPRQIEVQV